MPESSTKMVTPRPRAEVARRWFSGSRRWSMRSRPQWPNSLSVRSETVCPVEASVSGRTDSTAGSCSRRCCSACASCPGTSTVKPGQMREKCSPACGPLGPSSRRLWAWMAARCAAAACRLQPAALGPCRPHRRRVRPVQLHDQPLRLVARGLGRAPVLGRRRRTAGQPQRGRVGTRVGSGGG